MSTAAGAFPHGTLVGEQLLLGGFRISPGSECYYWINGIAWSNYSQSLWWPGEPNNAGFTVLTLFVPFFGIGVGKSCTITSKSLDLISL